MFICCDFVFVRQEQGRGVDTEWLHLHVTTHDDRNQGSGCSGSKSVMPSFSGRRIICFVSVSFAVREQIREVGEVINPAGWFDGVPQRLHRLRATRTHLPDLEQRANRLQRQVVRNALDVTDRQLLHALTQRGQGALQEGDRVQREALNLSDQTIHDALFLRSR